MVLIMMIGRGHANVEGREQRKDIRLNPRYQQFDQINEQHNQTRNKTDGHTLKNERKAYQAQQHDVPGRNGNKQTNCERKRLGKNPDNFDRQNHQPQGQWHARCPEDVTPVSAVAHHVGNDERERSERQGNGNISGEVPGPR